MTPNLPTTSLNYSVAKMLVLQFYIAWLPDQLSAKSSVRSSCIGHYWFYLKREKRFSFCVQNYFIWNKRSYSLMTTATACSRHLSAVQKWPKFDWLHQVCLLVNLCAIKRLRFFREQMYSLNILAHDECHGSPRILARLDYCFRHLQIYQIHNYFYQGFTVLLVHLTPETPAKLEQ